MNPRDKAHGIQPAPGKVPPPVQQSSTAPSPRLDTELRGCMERILRAHKAEAVAGEVDRKRSTVYRWAAHPEDIPAGALLALADLDPDPDGLARVAGCLLAHVATRALARQAQGRALLIIEESSPGRWTRR